MPDIVTNVLYQDIDRLQEKVKELKAERDKYLEELIVAKNVIKSDESQIKNLVKRNEEMRGDCIKTAEDRDRMKAEIAKARAMLEKTDCYHCEG